MYFGLACSRRWSATSSGLASGDVGGPAQYKDETAPEARTLPTARRPTKTSDDLLSSWEKIDGLADHEPQPRVPPRQPYVPEVLQQYLRAQDGMSEMEAYHKTLVSGSSGPTLGQSLRKEDSTLEGWVPLSEKVQTDTLEKSAKYDVRGPEAAPLTAEERAAFLNRAGRNPYDELHGDSSKVTPSMRSAVAAAEEQAKQDAAKAPSAEMQSFLKHMRLQAGIAGPLAPILRHQLNDSYAMPNMNLPVSNDTSISNLQRVLSDFDYLDRRMSNTVALTYPQGTNLLAAMLCAMLYFGYWYQREYRWMDWYDEFVGLDVRRVPEAEKPVLFLLTVGFIRVVLYHPACVLTVVLIRMTRIMRGRPIGPP